LFKVITV